MFRKEKSPFPEPVIKAKNRVAEMLSGADQSSTKISAFNDFVHELALTSIQKACQWKAEKTPEQAEKMQELRHAERCRVELMALRFGIQRKNNMSKEYEQTNSLLRDVKNELWKYSHRYPDSAGETGFEEAMILTYLESARNQAEISQS